MSDLNPAKTYMMFGGILMEFVPCDSNPPADPLSVDMELQAIAKVSDEDSCDHGVSLIEYCEQCSPENAEKA